MTKRIEIPFAKYQAVGNDFVVVPSSGLLFRPRPKPHRLPRIEAAGTPESADASALARSICHRQKGAGADGMLLILPPAQTPHDARMLVFNADGSQAEMSGNGIRCAAAYLLERGGKAEASPSARSQKRRTPRRLLMETAAGVRPVEVIEAGNQSWVFRVGMGKPILEAGKIPFQAVKSAPSPVAGFPLPLSSGAVPVTVSSMGNPHCSVFVDDLEALDWRRLGREIERHRLFPHHTNVEFIRVLSPSEIEVRFWERGVGQTQSSGTGSCAAVVASILNRRTRRKVRVRTLAGELDVAWPPRGGLTLTGPVELVARGIFTWRR